MDALPELVSDQAWLVITSKLSYAVDILTQDSECSECPLMHIATVPALQNSSFIVANASVTKYAVRGVDIATSAADGFDYLCQSDYHFSEYGVYQLLVTANSSQKTSTSCTVRELKAGVDSYIPLYVAAAVLFTAIILVNLISVYAPVVSRMVRNSVLNYTYRFRNGNNNAGNGHRRSSIDSTNAVTAANSSTNLISSPPVVVVAPITRTRVYSLDVFRGFIILAMIFVNNGGGGYWFFNHAIWNGLTFADLIFPWFMFIMGVAMVLSFRTLQRSHVSKASMLYKIIRRSAILFLLGLLVNTAGGASLTSIRIPGVLQRFSVAFLVVGLTEMFSSTHYIGPPSRCTVLRDIVPFWTQWVFTLALIALHTLLTFALPVPGCPTGYTGPGGLDHNSSYVNCTGGAAGYIDRLVLGSNHIYNWPTCQLIYQTQVPHDPEGILGALMSIVLVFFGIQAGRITHFYVTAGERLKRFCLWGLVLGLAALILCKASKNDGWIPVNKNLWSLSFILATGALAYFVLSFLYLLVDHWRVWSGVPLLYPGANAIALYVGSEVLSQAFPFSWKVPHETHAWQLFMSLWTTFMWFLVSCFMFYKKVFITV